MLKSLIENITNNLDKEDRNSIVRYKILIKSYGDDFIKEKNRNCVYLTINKGIIYKIKCVEIDNIIKPLHLKDLDWKIGFSAQIEVKKIDSVTEDLIKEWNDIPGTEEEKKQEISEIFKDK